MNFDANFKMSGVHLTTVFAFGYQRSVTLCFACSFAFVFVINCDLLGSYGLKLHACMTLSWFKCIRWVSVVTLLAPWVVSGC